MVWSVIGQDRAVSLLQRSLEAGSLAHAYLFVGPAHVGKMTLALNLAQALNCESSQPPCGECAACRKVVSGKHADVQIIGLGHSNDLTESRSKVEISIDQIREVQHSANLPPFEGRYRVFIIDGAELLSIEAANCLLKTLEEPLDKVLFLLLTTKEQFLPKTVISRCQRLELLPLTVTKVETALVDNWGVEPGKARTLARLSHGCIGWAVRALDELWLRQHTEKIDRLIDIVNADSEERFAYATQLATQFGQDRATVLEILNLWLDWWRDLLLVGVGAGDYVTNFEHSTMLNDMAGCYTVAQIRNFITDVQASREQLKQNANPRLALELLMLNIPEKGAYREGKVATQFEVNHG